MHLYYLVLKMCALGNCVKRMPVKLFHIATMQSYMSNASYLWQP